MAKQLWHDGINNVGRDEDDDYDDDDDDVATIRTTDDHDRYSDV